MKLHLTSPISILDVHSSSRTRGNDALRTSEHLQYGELLTAGKVVNLNYNHVTDDPKYLLLGTTSGN